MCNGLMCGQTCLELTGFRQGSVLSPFLFAVYLVDLAKLCNRKSNVFIILYADDILLSAPSVCELDNLFKTHRVPSLLYGFDACALTKSELSSLDFIVNRFL